MPLERLDNLVAIGKLKAEAPAQTELDGLCRSGSERLRDSRRKALSLSSRFDLVYNAGHALALAAVPWLPLGEPVHRIPGADRYDRLARPTNGASSTMHIATATGRSTRETSTSTRRSSRRSFASCRKSRSGCSHSPESPSSAQYPSDSRCPSWRRLTLSPTALLHGGEGGRRQDLVGDARHDRTVRLRFVARLVPFGIGHERAPLLLALGERLPGHEVGQLLVRLTDHGREEPGLLDAEPVPDLQCGGVEALQQRRQAAGHAAIDAHFVAHRLVLPGVGTSYQMLAEPTGFPIAGGACAVA